MGTSDPNLNAKNSDGSSFSISKYIMKSYYERYEQLDDSYYQDFIAQELPFGLCDIQPDNPNLVPRLIILNRKLIGEGSHRRLSSSIRISIQPRSITKTSHSNCGVILIERLPAGVFADPFELQHLLQRGGNCAFVSFYEYKELFNSCIQGCIIVSLDHLPGLICLMQCLMTLLFLEIKIWNHLHSFPIVLLLRFTWMLISVSQGTRARLTSSLSFHCMQDMR